MSALPFNRFYPHRSNAKKPRPLPTFDQVPEAQRPPVTKCPPGYAAGTAIYWTARPTGPRRLAVEDHDADGPGSYDGDGPTDAFKHTTQKGTATISQA